MTAVMSAWVKSSATSPPPPAAGIDRVMSAGAWARGRPASVEFALVRGATLLDCDGATVPGGVGVAGGGAATDAATERGGTSGSVRDNGDDDRGLVPLGAQPATSARTATLHGRMLP